MKALISSRVSANFAALAASALLVAGCSTEEVELPLQIPGGFVEVSKEQALKLAEGLSACFVKEGVYDTRKRDDWRHPYGSVDFSKTHLGLEDALALTPFGAGNINAYGSNGAECQRLTGYVITNIGKANSTRQPNYVLTPEGNVTLVVVGGKILTPQPSGQ